MMIERGVIMNVIGTVCNSIIKAIDMELKIHPSLFGINDVENLLSSTYVTSLICTSAWTVTVASVDKIFIDELVVVFF